MNKYICAGAILFEKEIEAESEEEAKNKMYDYLCDDVATLDWTVTATDIEE